MATTDRTWTDTRAELQQLFTARPEEAATKWLGAYAEAYVGDDQPRLDQLADASFEFPSRLAEMMRSRFEPAADALRNGRVADARERLTAGAHTAFRSARSVLDVEITDQALRNDVNQAAIHALTGCWLEEFGDAAASAASYYEASTRLVGAGGELLVVATDLLTHAIELAPSALTYWQLADVWRLRSYIPTPPYIDRARLARSIEAWEHGMTLERPDFSTSWAYVARALTSEHLARLEEAERTSHWWDAALYLERAILLDSSEATRWAYLGRCHRFLENDATAMQATAAALENQPDEPTSLEERAAILINAGAFDQARSSLDERLAQDPDNTWAHSVKAYVLSRQRDYQTARSLIEKVITAEPDDVWNLDVLATCCRMLGDLGGAREAYARIRRLGASMSTLSIDDRRSYAFALYQLGEVDEAIVLLDTLAEDAIARDDAWRLLGLCHFVKGSISRAEELLLRGVARGTARELDDFLALELSDLEARDTGQGALRERAVVLGRVRATATALLAERRHTTSDEASDAAEAELREIVRAGEPAYPLTAVLVARAGLARSLLKAERWHEAADVYRELQSASPSMPEAALGAERAIAGLGDEAHRLMREGNRSEAMQTFRQLLSLASAAGGSDRVATAHRDLANGLWSAGQREEAAAHFRMALSLASTGDLASRADLHGRLALAQQDLGNLGEAREHYARALACFRDGGVTAAGDALATSCIELLRDTQHFWEVDAQWSLCATDGLDTGEWRGEMSQARTALMRYLDRAYRLSEHEDDQTVFPSVRPIRLDVGTTVRPLVDPKSDLGRFIEVDIPAMLKRVESSVGLPALPGIRVTASATDAEGYEIALDGGTVATGTVHVGARFYAQRRGDATQSGGGDTRDPVSGESGTWYPSALLLTETEFMLAHVEAVLRQHMDLFVTPERASRVLKQLANEPAQAAFATSLLADERLVVAFARVVRALMKQQVRLTDWSAIVPVLEKRGWDDLSGTVLALRGLLKEHLPGNEEDATRIAVPAALENLATGDLGAPVPVSPEQANVCLIEIRDLMQRQSTPVTLVASSDRVREIVARLVAYEFPRVAVLTSDEVLHRHHGTAAAVAASTDKHEAKA